MPIGLNCMQMIKVDGMIILVTGGPDQLGLPPIVPIHSMHIMTSYTEAEETSMHSSNGNAVSIRRIQRFPAQSLDSFVRFPSRSLTSLARDHIAVRLVLIAVPLVHLSGVL